MEVFVQSWNLTGNASTDPATQFLGTTDTKALRIRTNNTVCLQITSGGKPGFGTGTSSPAGWFHIKGKYNESQLIIDAAASQTRANPFLILSNNSGSELARIHSDHYSNFFAGYLSGVNNSYAGGGFSNTFIGTWEGSQNTTGSFNTAIGNEALSSNTLGYQNTTVGHDALLFNSIGAANTAIGNGALRNNTEGIANNENASVKTRLTEMENRNRAAISHDKVSRVAAVNPNPVKNLLNLSLEMHPAFSAASIVICDVTKPLTTETVTTSGNSAIDGSAPAPGTCLIHLYVDGKAVDSKTILIQHESQNRNSPVRLIPFFN